MTNERLLRVSAGAVGAGCAAYGAWFAVRVDAFDNRVLLAIPLGAFAIAAPLLLFAAAGNRSRVRDYVKSMLVGGVVVGGLAFAAGFFGPILLSPGSNQGPLLGIVITGPLGFALGCLGGMFAAVCKQRRVASS